MDLRKRLARLDPGHREPATMPAAVERTAAEFGLEEKVMPEGTIWRRRCPAVLPPPDLPDLAGFLSRHETAARTAADLLFLDTETTGLAGGTGTVPFLVGLAWWDGADFVVEQIFLPGPAHEGALLAAVAEAASHRRVVVTYNGASFDLPLLRTRALLQRHPSPVAELAGWDLVVPARRLWSRSLPDCRQQTVEVEVYGRPRGEGDIPGGRIPQVWFDFLAEGRADLLPAVLRHNRRDMEGMGRILGAVCEAAAGLDRPEDVAAWRDAWSRARICSLRGDHHRAAAWLARSREAKPAAGHAPLVADGVRMLKRLRHWPSLADLITAALAAGLDEPWLHVEAAMLYEHRLVDLERALAHARAAGDDRRTARLERRLSGTTREEERP
ncbi:MAG: hypothetical protein GY838_06390 [bacterium]|nr:hypothetical protein [bacterium]